MTDGQMALFPEPTDEGPGSYKERRTVRQSEPKPRTIFTASGYTTLPPIPPDRSKVSRSLDRSDVPLSDTRRLKTKVVVDGDQQSAGSQWIRNLMAAGRSSYNAEEDVIRTTEKGLSDQRGFVHELGHAVHFATSPKNATPRTNLAQYPHPVLEGTADGYADRYAEVDVPKGEQPPPEVDPVGDAVLRARATKRNAEQLDPGGRGYTARYQKQLSDGVDNRTEWDAHDRLRYLASRQFAGQTGAPIPMGRPSALGGGVAGVAMAETGHMLLKADEVAGSDPDITDTLFKRTVYNGSDWNTAKDSREAAIMRPLIPWEQQRTGDDPRIGEEDSRQVQRTFFPRDLNPHVYSAENYRLSVHNAQQVARRADRAERER